MPQNWPQGEDSGGVKINNAVIEKLLASPSSFIQAWDWHCQSANSGGVLNHWPHG